MKNQMSRFEEQKTKNSKKYISNKHQKSPSHSSSFSREKTLFPFTKSKTWAPLEREVEQGISRNLPLAWHLRDLKEYFLLKNGFFPIFLEKMVIFFWFSAWTMRWDRESHARFFAKKLKNNHVAPKTQKHFWKPFQTWFFPLNFRKKKKNWKTRFCQQCKKKILKILKMKFRTGKN